MSRTELIDVSMPVFTTDTSKVKVLSRASTSLSPPSTLLSVKLENVCTEKEREQAHAIDSLGVYTYVRM